MPRIPDSYLNSVIYLYPSVAEAHSGERSGGSGFLVRVGDSYDLSETHLYAVTAKHVLRRGKSFVVRATKPSKTGTETAILETDAQSWHDHPDGDDLSICPITEPTAVATFTGISERMLIRNPDIEPQIWTVGPGTEAFWVGRFITHDGRQKNLPSVRFGNVSMLPLEPIRSEEGLLQESYLVEAKSLPGASGSPVYVYYPAFRPERQRLAGRRPAELAPLGKHSPLLLGVDWAHLKSFGEVFEVHDGQRMPVAGYRVELNSGMMAVVPAWKISEILATPELVEQRRQQDRERTRRRTGSPASPHEEAGS